MHLCQICSRKFQNLNGLGKHIHAKHEISRKQYYDEYIKIVNSKCICGIEKKFRSLGEGYRQYCNPKCYFKNAEMKTPWLGKKQPQEMIDKRRKTQLERYGVACGFLVGHCKTENYKKCAL